MANELLSLPSVRNFNDFILAIKTDTIEAAVFALSLVKYFGLHRFRA